MSKAIFTFSIFFISLVCQAQFRQSAGGSTILGLGNVPSYVPYSVERPWFMGSGLSYYPQYNIIESKNSAIALGIPLSFGFNFIEDDYGESEFIFLADLPLMVDMKFGTGSNSGNSSKYGVFFGGGLGYTYTNQSFNYFNGIDNRVEKVKAISYGPMVHAGMNFDLGIKLHYFVRLSFKYGLESENFKTFGLATGVGF